MQYSFVYEPLKNEMHKLSRGPGNELHFFLDLTSIERLIQFLDTVIYQPLAVD